MYILLGEGNGSSLISKDGYESISVAYRWKILIHPPRVKLYRWASMKNK